MDKTSLRAYHGKPSVKATYLKRIRAHAKADEIVKGFYWDKGKGCAVGCTIHSDDHQAYETELGLPRWLARLEDGMFERLPNGAAKTFPARFLAAIPVGADVSGVREQFLAWLMDDPKYGTAFLTKDAEIKALALEVAQRLRSGKGVSGPEADELTSRLWAAWDARDARDAWDAWDAWAARADWDARAARADWDARAARAAWDARVIASSVELLRLLKAAPVKRRKSA